MPNVLEKLDYQVSIYSLIPPATAISKTQDRRTRVYDGNCHFRFFSKFTMFKGQ